MQMQHVLSPAIVPTLIIMMILYSGNFLDTGFEQIFMLTNSLNREVADVFDTYVYFLGITNGAYSYSTAIGLFKGIVALILILGANWLARRFTQSSLSSQHHGNPLPLHDVKGLRLRQSRRPAVPGRPDH